MIFYGMTDVTGDQEDISRNCPEVLEYRGKYKIDILSLKLYNEFIVFVAKKRRIADRKTKEKENG